MSSLSIPVAIANAAMTVIPAVVFIAVRRYDRTHRPALLPADSEAGTLFVVRNRRWQSVMLRALGILFLVVGAFFTLVSVVEADRMPSAGPLIAAGAITVFGALFVVLAIGVKRTRIDVFDDRLLVRYFLKKERAVLLSDIGFIEPSMNRLGGMDVKDRRRKMLFTATAIAIGYPMLFAFLEERAPHAWNPPPTPSRERVTVESDPA